MLMKHLTKHEEDIMELSWKNGYMFVKDLVALLSNSEPHNNALSTMVRGMEDKGFLNHEQIVNTYRYFAIITRPKFYKNSIKNLISKLNKGVDSTKYPIVIPQKQSCICRQSEITK